jgi:hypothetical protein
MKTRAIPLATCCALFLPMILVSATSLPSYVSNDLDFVRIDPRQSYVIPSVNCKIVYIPPGMFMMGSPEIHLGRAIRRIKMRLG